MVVDNDSQLIGGGSILLPDNEIPEITRGMTRNGTTNPIMDMNYSGRCSKSPGEWDAKSRGIGR